MNVQKLIYSKCVTCQIAVVSGLLWSRQSLFMSRYVALKKLKIRKYRHFLVKSMHALNFKVVLS